MTKNEFLLKYNFKSINRIATSYDNFPTHYIITNDIHFEMDVFEFVIAFRNKNRNLNNRYVISNSDLDIIEQVYLTLTEEN